MSDFEMPYFIDGGGNKGYFVDPTAREQINNLTAVETYEGNIIEADILDVGINIFFISTTE